MAYTESLLLPSRGIIYNVPNFDGYVNVKPFTTKNYKDLLTANASESGLKQFIEACLVDCPIKAKDMNQNDLLAILFKIRSITLGNKLKTQVKCPECKAIEDIEWDLDDIEINYLFVDEYPIKVALPTSGEEIKVKFVTGKDSTAAKQAAEKRATMFKKQISEYLPLYETVSRIEVNGKDIVERAEWYESLHPSDAIYIDEVFSEMVDTFGVKMTREEQCSKCDKVYETYIDIGSDFFRPYSVKPLGISRKAGNLAGVVEKPNISE